MSSRSRPFHDAGRAAPWALTLLAILAASVLTLVALVQWHDHPLPLPASHPVQQVSLPPAQPPAGLSFSTLLTSQSAGAPEGLLVAGGRWSTNRRPVQFAVLIRHPQGNLLFDTGLGCDHAEQFAANNAVHRQLFAYTMNAAVKTQLEQHGMGDLPLRWIIPSHMHWDHIGGLPDFPNVPVWVPPAERQQASNGAPPAFLASQFKNVSQWLDLRFEHGPVLGFDRSQDVFGDGSVVLLPLPGHTAGQVGLLLSLPSGQRYLFTADTTWLKDGIDRAADRSWLLRRAVALDHDEAANQAAIVHLHLLSKRIPSLRIVPAHDEHVHQQLPQFPTFQH